MPNESDIQPLTHNNPSITPQWELAICIVVFLLTADKYKNIEDNYINAIQLVMDYLRIPYLTINNVRRSFSYDTFQEIREKIQELYSKDVLETYLHVKDRDKLDKKKLDLFCRLLLREDIDAEVYYPRRMKVVIGL